LRLFSGSSSEKLQTTANSIFAVLKGSGRTDVDGAEIQWNEGDTIAIPAWRPYQHHASLDAVLFRVTDSPVLDKLNLLRVLVL
jgi:gentisate 1,2-dioxygenase